MYAIFLDLETTGLDAYVHRTLEIAFKIIQMDHGQEVCAYQSVVRQPEEVWNGRDPSSIEINGFTWDKLLTGKDEQVIRQEIIACFQQFNIERGKAVFICQNPAFDRAFFSQIINVYTQEQLKWPYHWLDFASMYWAFEVKKAAINNRFLPCEMNLSKNSIAQLHGLPIETYPHSAMGGVDHLLLCYKQVVGFLD